MYAKWQNAVSEPFSVANGVRQGAILSPILFCLYIDVLLKRLASSRIGCHIENIYYGALGYADDLVLLSPSRDGLQRMLNICERYGDEYDMRFNAGKTKCMLMSNTLYCNNIAPLRLSGHDLSWVKSFEYLGIHVTPDLKDRSDIMCKRGRFISNVNNLLCSFSTVQCNLLNKLFDSYCTSFYGCQTWSLKDSNLRKLTTAYNIALPKIWQLPWTAHTNIVLSVAGKRSLFEVLEKRFYNLYRSMLDSDNPSVNFIVRYAQQDRTSLIGGNIDIICKNRNIVMNDLKDLNTLHVYDSISTEEYVLGQTVRELCLCRDNTLALIEYSKHDIQNLVDFLSTQ